MRQERRLRLLVAIYERTDGIRDFSWPVYPIATALGIEQKELADLFSYLRDEGLIQGAFDRCMITHKGIVEVERAITKPRQGTEHFARAVVMHFHGAVGAVQTGEQARAEVEQKP